MPLISIKEFELMLLEAKEMEKLAEENCDKVLNHLDYNRIYKEIAKIENDEKKHQKIVAKLIKMLKS